MKATPSGQIDIMQLHLWKQVKRIGPLGAIIFFHLAFFYALQKGLVKQAVQAFPKEVFVSFITPERAPEPAPPKPQPEAPPKPNIVPAVKKSVTRPAPPVSTPSPTAVTAPPTPPEPAAPAAVSEPAPAPTAPAAPRTITSGVEYIQAPQPEYPAAAKRMGEEGQVILRVLVNEKGRSEGVDIQKSSGSTRLDEAARQSVRRALFKPYIDNGKPVAVYAIVPIKFQLDN